MLAVEFLEQPSVMCLIYHRCEDGAVSFFDIHVVGQVDVVEDYKLKSWVRWKKLNLAWIRQTAEQIRFYLLQYDVN